MDPALPPGGLDVIFQQYDAIRSHGATAPDTPPWEPEDEQPRGDSPDKSTPEATPLRTNERIEVANRRPPIEVTGTLTRLRIPTQRAPLTPNPNFIGGADVNGDIVSLSAPRPTYISDDGVVTLDGPGPPQKVLTDATSDRPKGKPKSWQHDSVEQMQEELGRRKMLTDLSRTSRGNFTRDEYGMQKAYEDLPNTGTYYDISGLADVYALPNGTASNYFGNPDFTGPTGPSWYKLGVLTTPDRNGRMFKLEVLSQERFSASPFDFVAAELIFSTSQLGAENYSSASSQGFFYGCASVRYNSSGTFEFRIQQTSSSTNGPMSYTFFIQLYGYPGQGMFRATTSPGCSFQYEPVRTDPNTVDAMLAPSVSLSNNPYFVGKIGLANTSILNTLGSVAVHGLGIAVGALATGATGATGKIYSIEYDAEMIRGNKNFDAARHVFNEKVVATVTPPSDRRLKENIQAVDIATCSRIVHEVPIKTFKLKSNGAPSIGVIAQDLESLLPESNAFGIVSDFVHRETPQDEPMVTKCVDYTRLHTLVHVVVQEQEKRIKSLETRLAILEKISSQPTSV